MQATPSASPRSPGRATPTTSFRVELQVDGWDRPRLLEDLSRTFAEAGINILEARCTVVHPMVKNRFVVEVGDTQSLKTCITRLRNIESVFDAYRVTPTGWPLGNAPAARPGRAELDLVELADVVAVHLDAGTAVVDRLDAQRARCSPEGSPPGGGAAPSRARPENRRGISVGISSGVARLSTASDERAAVERRALADADRPLCGSR